MFVNWELQHTESFGPGFEVSEARLASGANQFTRIFFSTTADLGASSNYCWALVKVLSCMDMAEGRTIEVTFACSFAGVTATDWTKNLSLHLASAAGSSFMACSSTVTA